MTELVVMDIGGTHARFALAQVEEGRVAALGAATTFRTADYASLQTAWEAYGAQLGRPLPKAASIAVACAIKGDVLKLTNNPWIIRPALVPEKLGVIDYAIVNDFEAIGHAVAQASADDLAHICGPDVPLPESGTITIVGPGTGLGVAHIHRGAGGYIVNPTEGGHIDFAPTDPVEDAILARLRKRHGRVSAERVASGPGIVEIFHTLAEIEGRSVEELDDLTIWKRGLAGEDALAAAAVDRFCMSFGGIVGDLALAQGGQGVVIAGGLGARLKDVLVRSGFADRFRAKGRFESLMASLPVKLITLEQPGLFGAAAAFAGRATAA